MCENRNQWIIFALVALIQRALFQKPFKEDLFLANFGHFLLLNIWKQSEDNLKFSENLTHAQLQEIYNNYKHDTIFSPVAHL